MLIDLLDEEQALMGFTNGRMSLDELDGKFVSASILLRKRYRH